MKGSENMKESLMSDELFRHAFVISTCIGILSRAFVLRVKDKQYPSRPQDYLEQIIISGLSSSLGAVVFPALLDKEFAALTFFAVAIQQFQGLSKEERITLENIDNDQIVPKGSAYIEEISSTYEARSYISLASSLGASITYIRAVNVYELGFWGALLASSVIGFGIAFILRRFLRRDSVADVAEIKPAKITFDGPILKVNEMMIHNIGLEDTRKRYVENGLAVEIIPKNMADFGVINDLGQRQAILHNLYIHLGIDKDVDEKDILSITRVNYETKSVLIPYIPLKKDLEVMIDVIRSTPIIETAKGTASAYKSNIS